VVGVSAARHLQVEFLVKLGQFGGATARQLGGHGGEDAVVAGGVINSV
jgi:hypothetical protein